MPQWVFKYLTLEESPFVPLAQNIPMVVKLYNSFFDPQVYEETLVILQIFGGEIGNDFGTLTLGSDKATFYLESGGSNLFAIARLHAGFLYVPVTVPLPYGFGRIGGVFNPESLVPPKDLDSRLLISEDGVNVEPVLSKVVNGETLLASRIRYFITTDSEGGPASGSLSDFFGFFGDVFGNIGSATYNVQIGPPLLDPDYSYEPYLDASDPWRDYGDCKSPTGSGSWREPFRRYRSFFFVLPEEDHLGVIPMTGPTFHGERIAPPLPVYFKVLFWLPKKILNSQGINLIKNFSPPLNSGEYNYKFSALTNKDLVYKGRQYQVSVTSDPSDRVAVMGWHRSGGFMNLTRSLEDIARFHEMTEAGGPLDKAHSSNPIFIGV